MRVTSRAKSWFVSAQMIRLFLSRNGSILKKRCVRAVSIGRWTSTAGSGTVLPTRTLTQRVGRRFHGMTPKLPLGHGQRCVRSWKRSLSERITRSSLQLQRQTEHFDILFYDLRREPLIGRGKIVGLCHS